MQKRGQLVNKALIVLIVSAIVIVAFISAGKSHGSQEAYYKLAVAKDISLAIDMISGMSGDVSFTYPNDVTGYDIGITKNTVTIYDTKYGRLDPIKASYIFSTNGFAIEGAYIILPQYIVIEKSGNKISVKESTAFQGFGGSGKFSGRGSSGEFQ